MGRAAFRRRFASPFLAIVLVAGIARAEVRVDATVDSSSIAIGDPVTYRLLVTWQAGDSVVLPPVGANFTGFTVLRREPVPARRADDGTMVRGEVFRITAYRPGTYVVPPVPIAYRLAGGQSGELVTQPIVIEVRGLGVAATDTLRDIKSPLLLPRPLRAWVWMALAGFAVLAALAVFWFRWRKRPPKEAPVARAPVAADDLAELDAIPASDLIARGEIKALYILVSDAIRRYVERRYGIAALELTHAELEGAFAAESVARGEAALILDFLARCDLVKFAKFVPSDDEVRSLVDRAKELVIRTRFSPPPVAVAPEPSAEEEPA